MHEDYHASVGGAPRHTVVVACVSVCVCVCVCIYVFRTHFSATAKNQARVHNEKNDFNKTRNTPIQCIQHLDLIAKTAKLTAVIPSF